MYEEAGACNRYTTRLTQRHRNFSTRLCGRRARAWGANARESRGGGNEGTEISSWLVNETAVGERDCGSPSESQGSRYSIRAWGAELLRMR